MTAELTALTLAALLQVAQLCLYSVVAQMAVGTKTALKPRDQPVELTGTAGRAYRALNNHFEGLILFSIACLVVTLSGQSSGFTGFCAFLYLAARVFYIPAYVYGWVPARSLIWAAGFLATVLMLFAALV